MKGKDRKGEAPKRFRDKTVARRHSKILTVTRRRRQALDEEFLLFLLGCWRV